MNFDKLNLDPSIMAGVAELGYTELTPIQEKSIPPALEGRDVIGLAQTGTGKTASFVLPVLQKLVNGPKRKTRAAIITPTRELAEQVNNIIVDLGKYTGLNSLAIYGGTNMDRQITEIGYGVEIIVACPGRLLDHLWRGTIDLSELDMLVIDEADRMFDMGFAPDIRRIIKCLTKPRQTMLYSATMPNDIRKLVNEILTDPVTVEIGQSAPAKTVSHAIYPVKQHLKPELLMELLYSTDYDSVLVFTRTKHRTERIARQLKKAGFRVASLQGDLSQSRRQAAMDAFRSGAIKVLVATDIAARGLDILHISHVINVDMPENTDAYIHRIGRTGRINQSGDAITFVTQADMPMVESIEKILKKKIERRTIDGFDYSAPAPEKSGQRGGRAPARQTRTQTRSQARSTRTQPRQALNQTRQSRTPTRKPRRQSATPKERPAFQGNWLSGRKQAASNTG